MELAEKLLAYYKENMEDFNNDIEELDDWTGCLYDDKIYPMEQLNELFQGKEPEEILKRAFYGYDEPYKNGDPSRPFNPNRDYFYFNGYGNLVSISQRDYTDYLDTEFIQEIINNSYNLSLSVGSQTLIDYYEDEDE